MSDEHDAIEDLLPWYLNGSLDAADRARVDAALAREPGLRAELDWLRQVQAQVRTEEADQPGLGELGLRRLLRDVARERRGRLIRRWSPGVAAAALLIVLVQSVALVRLSALPPEPFRPLGGDTTGTVLVRFQPDATEAELRAALANVDGVIVDGPSAIGLYRLRLPPENRPERLRALEASGVVLQLQEE